MPNPLTAGQTTSHGVNLVGGIESSGVAHEQTRTQQTKNMVNAPYAPLQRIKPRTAGQAIAAMLTDPKTEAENLNRRLQKAEQFVNPTAVKSHSRKSKAKAFGADLLALANRGNVTGNMEEALEVTPKPSKKLIKKSVPRTVPVAGYASSEQNEHLLALNRDLKEIRSMKREISDMLQMIQTARENDRALVHSATASEARKYRDQCDVKQKANPEAARAELKELAEQCIQLTTDIDAHQRKIDARAEDMELAGKTDPLTELVEGMKSELARLEPKRDILSGTMIASGKALPTDELRKLETTLTKLEQQRQEQIEAGNQSLIASHQAEINALLTDLPKLDQFSDKQALRTFIKDGLGQVKLDGSYDVNGKDTPPPMLLRNFMLALAGVARGDTVPLNRSTLEATYQEMKSVVGGVAMFEQITGNKIAAEERTAHRVLGLAQSNQQRLSAVADGSPQSRPRALSRAENTAKAVISGKGKRKPDLRNDACYSAVRNDFYTKSDGSGIDPRLENCNHFLTNLQQKLVTNTQSKHAVRDAINVSKNKTPLGDATIKLASMTSTLGYDDESRPQARLDKNLTKAINHLKKLVILDQGKGEDDALAAIASTESSAMAMSRLNLSIPSIAPKSLDADQLLRLAGVLTAEQIAKKSGEDIRPGHVDLEEKHTLLLTQTLEKLQKLHKPGAGKIDAEAVAAFIKDHGQRVANPYDMVDLVDSLAQHIPLTVAKDDDNQVRKELLANINEVRHLTSVEEITRIRTPQDLYLYLKPKLYQFELRGKLRMSGGGNLGASSKILTWPLDLDGGAFSVVMPIRPVVGANKVRCSVVEISFTTYGMEMLVGTEDRQIKSIGAGAGVRLSGAGVSTGGGIDRTTTFERSNIKGTIVRVPRGSSDDDARVDMDRALQTILGVDENGDSVDGNNHLVGHLLDDDDTQLMPKLVGNLMGKNANVSLTSIGTMYEDSVRHESNPNFSVLTVAVPSSNPDGARIQVGALGVRSERVTKTYRQEDDTGYLKVNRSNNFSGGSLWEQASALAVNGLYQMTSDANASENYGVLNRQKQRPESGVDVKLRDIELDGETQAVNTRIDIEDVNFKNHLERVEPHKHDLIALGEEQLYKGAKNPPGSYERHYNAQNLLHQKLGQSEDKSTDNSRHVHALSFCMEPSAARRKDALNAASELERRHGDPVQAKAYADQAKDVIKHPQAVKLWKLTTSERTSKNQQVGLNFGVTAGHVSRTQGQRGTNSYPK